MGRFFPKTMGLKGLSQGMKSSTINHQEAASLYSTKHYLQDTYWLWRFSKEPLVYSSHNSSYVIDILSVKIYNIKVQVTYNGRLKKAQFLELKSLNVPQRTRFLLIRYTVKKKKTEKHPPFVTAKEHNKAQQESSSDLHYTPDPCRCICSFSSSTKELYWISHTFGLPT